MYFDGLCHCAKFCLSRCSSFDNMKVLIFWALSLGMPIHAHFGGGFGGKNWENQKLSVVLSFYECNTPGLTSYESNIIKIGFPVWSLDASKNWGHKQKNKNHARVILHPFAGTPWLGWSVWILACWVISPTQSPMPNFATIGSGVSEFWYPPPILPFSIGIAGCPYNSPSTNVLHCDIWLLVSNRRHHLGTINAKKNSHTCTEHNMCLNMLNYNAI